MLEILISHDVDHIGLKEHLKHFFSDRLILRDNYREWVKWRRGKISLRKMLSRWIGSFRIDFWSNMDDLIDFDIENNVNSTWFVAVKQRGIVRYTLEQSKKAIRDIQMAGFEVGLHCLYYESLDEIKDEYRLFKKISGNQKVGVRTHQLRLDQNTLKNFDKIGFIFDSSIYSFNHDQPFKIGNMIEIPLHIMDSRFMGPRQMLGVDAAVKETERFLKEAEERGIKYVSILFHDKRFSRRYFPSQRAWYIWLIKYCKSKNYKFINYYDLCKEN